MRIIVAATMLSAMLGGPVFAQDPASQSPPAGQQQAPMPFPEGAKVAFVDFQQVASNSVEGKAASAKVQALNQQKVTELNDKNKELQALQQKAQQGLTVLSDEARLQLQKDIERLQIDIQRFTQDAQAEVQDLQQQLQLEFQRKVMPVVEQVANDRGLHMIFTTEAGIAWAHRGLDVTAEVIKRFDAASKAAGDAAASADQTPPE